MKGKSKQRFLSLVLAFTLIFSNFLGIGNVKKAFAAGAGTWDNPYSVAETIAAAATVTTATDAQVSAVGYIVDLHTAGKGIVLADTDTKPSTADKTNIIYVLPNASTTQNMDVMNNWNTADKIGKKVKVYGNWRKKDLAAYGTEKVVTIGTVYGKDIRIEEVTGEVVAVSGVSLDKTEATIEVEETLTLTANVQPTNATNKKVTWSSDAQSVATVANGVVTAVGEGQATITATTEDGAKTATCIVTVTLDSSAPEITKLEPADGDILDVTNTQPGLRVEFTDESGINLDSIKLELDDVDVTARATKQADSVSYVMDTPITNGMHTAKVVVADEKGNVTEKSWSFSIGQPEYNYYYGQLHSHSNLSDGAGTPDDAFTWARDKGEADFFALTDHSNWFDNDKANENITDYKTSTSVDWKTLREKADFYNENGKFAAIGGYEMTWSGSTGGWGHINTFNTEWFVSRSNSAMDLKTYYNKIAQNPTSINQLNHPGKTFGDFADFGFYSAAADNVVNLVEVGNGEGPVRGTGYFPSYEFYTRALDKGWHVAPTNNQDNHKQGWITANDARTVVLAPQLTRESVYEAMKQMRVYSTEDKNLKVMFTANGKIMGSSLSNPTELNININIQDPDSTDKISKVSIISNGGVVVDSKTFDSNTATWNLTLDPQYSYYYVRVDQADKDIAVTAPVWTGEVIPYGVAKVEASQNPQILGKSVDLTATVYNNGTTPLTDVKVEFFKNSIAGANKIGEQTIATVAASGTGTAKISWNSEVTGSINVYAQIVVNDKAFSASTILNVVHEDDVVKVVIDGGHQNQYVSGDYKGKMLTIKEMLTEKNYLLIENPDELTADDLTGVKILVLTDPQSKDVTKYGLTKSNYTDAEIQVIKDYIASGGSLIITSRADYDDVAAKDANGNFTSWVDPDYQSSVQGNRILEAIGSNLRFNDDEVVDNTSNGGQSFRLYFDDYNSSKYNLLNNIPEGYTYSAYSGCSVILKDGGSDENVDWLIKGHDTTETIDSDLQNDLIPVEKGEVNTLAAEILPSGSKIVVAGTTFFSDFETASNDNAYSNKIITENIIRWFTLPQLSTIAEARMDSDQDGKPDNFGKKFMIEGTVTAASKAAVKNTAFFDTIYVQDETGGITVFGVSTRAIPLGTKIRVVGTVDQYDGDTELSLENENIDIEVISSEVEPLEPMFLPTGLSMLEEMEGWLVGVLGKVTRMTDDSIYVDDGTGEAKVYVNGYIGDDSDNDAMLGKWDPSIKVGDLITAVGLASEDPEGHRIRVRNTSEIRKFIFVSEVTLNKTKETLKVGEELQLTATVKPENADLNILVWISDNEEVATVDPVSGNVSAIKAGTANIYAIPLDSFLTLDFENLPEEFDMSIFPVYGKCEVTVEEPAPEVVPVTGISLDTTSATIKVGDNIVVGATVLPADATNKNIVWSSDNEAVATVTGIDNYGKIIGVKAGTAKITATTADGSLKAQIVVTVKDKIVVVPGVDETTFGEEIDRTIASGSKEVVLEVQPSGSPVTTVSIPLRSLKAAQEYDLNIRVNEAGYTFVIPADAIDLSGIEPGENVVIEFSKDILNDDEIKGILGDSSKGLEIVGKVLDLTMTVKTEDGKVVEIHNFKDRVKVVVNLSDKDLEGVDVSKLAAYYYNPTTGKWEMVLGGRFNKDSKTFTFETDHFSTYAIMESTNNLPKTGSYAGMLPQVGMFLVVVGGAMVLFRRRRTE